MKQHIPPLPGVPETREEKEKRRLIDALVERLLDDGDIDDLRIWAEEGLTKEYENEYTLDQLKTEVGDHYPDILEEEREAGLAEEQDADEDDWYKVEV